ncbi:MAG: hypothetical protein A3F95_02605 [Candidatus Nealsonbacteria bacterium RIFCSPLOWO2_12_FULL_39_31]|uniref:HTH deoR-type domain-containing protein n=3 Tax=Candidatus Nealsoniibacteriota TaxID=1817911 RepID=A0A1G2ELM1_9BACT|nr:MAG: hypothetical protein US88_C0001G0030 [Parcubacteria group bacterium GW2011_GWA2_38_27]OGZ19233.1 MAG: hypothetical protein A2626_01355 [Candidatus Nealsonbacteria bacterium RIFCSPHIGHO2_01_FULL_38_55]OGZ21076.1 MAG: hypothetical protein A3C48_02375 [Candidatus Nealsonbacteria bacterium RIFCSPHIGHO2_02_FULL_38_75]OGZ22916.1 MAG: hypothetical protein A2981_02450 [Candidatus Nealsonbacteria bacterium RIFCSPLOWO2_01_FULL_38_120]OGZ25790.1 MAG: hypothetical protein A3I85_02130 [Candidatus Ne
MGIGFTFRAKLHIIIKNMEDRNIVELTNKIYKITLLFPKKEPLRYKIREAADEVLKSLAVWEVCVKGAHTRFFLTDVSIKEKVVFELEKNFNILKKYFEVVKWQNWLGYFDILEIEEKYDKIKSDFEKDLAFLNSQAEILKTRSVFEWQEKETVGDIKEQVRQGDNANKKQEIVALKEWTENNELDSRKEKILDFLKERGRVQVWEIKEILPDISKRTLRRDFDKLLKLKIVERVGERNETFYRLKV